MKNRTDLILTILTAVFVGGLAIVAGAISFDHMRELATHHDQLGWKSYAFPVSVDGLEIVASLYLVAQRRAGRATGWIPWTALLVGTAASLSANIAVGGADPIGKALAGWPALSMLASVKLLFSMFDHGIYDQRTIARDDQRTSGTVPNIPKTVQATGREASASSGAVPDRRTEGSDPSPTGSAVVPAALPDATGRPASNRTSYPADQLAGDADIRTVARLVPAARAARLALAEGGRSLSRDNLADAMRDAGNAVSNVRASLLLKILKAERDVSAVGPRSVPSRSAVSRASPGTIA